MSTKLRYTEYYDMQKNLDWLYKSSLENRTKGINLYKIITSENNIMLAYRNIKSNVGSKTQGIDQKTINDFKMINKEQVISELRKSLKNFQPEGIRRVEIPKVNGKMRTLGIPTMRDRLIQQMFKQVLEPICEAKFYKHSYGFRPNRSAHHAVSRCTYLINHSTFHYVVDIDIKGFFDNINHNKLLSQLYTIGVQDKRVLTIIQKMLKAPINKRDKQVKGTPQGGILSPLLSNVVLNDLDQWISSQWEQFPSRYPYKNMGDKHVALRRDSCLKEMHIVRYADDFKIFAKSYKDAWKIFHAVKGYLKNHLKLEISKEKSKITNLRKSSSEFLGFEIIAVKKRMKYVANTHISKKNKRMIKDKVKNQLKKIQKSPTFENAKDYNSYVLGIHNYYRIASHVNTDFSEIAYSLLYTQYNRLKFVGKYEVPRSPPKVYERCYRNKGKTFKIGTTYLFPLSDIQWKFSSNFSQSLCEYTETGRRDLHKKLKFSVIQEIHKLHKNAVHIHNMEYTDNRISKYSMQNGKCAITGIFLTADTMNCHHILPKNLGGTDNFNNLVIIHELLHRLIHATNLKTIELCKRSFRLNGKQMEKVNKYREKCNLSNIY